jgi:hypothetical protein
MWPGITVSAVLIAAKVERLYAPLTTGTCVNGLRTAPLDAQSPLAEDWRGGQLRLRLAKNKAGVQTHDVLSFLSHILSAGPRLVVISVRATLHSRGGTTAPWTRLAREQGGIDDEWGQRSRLHGGREGEVGGRHG